MIHITARQFANYLPNANITNDFEIKGVSADTRLLKPGNLFVAIKGQRVDGHDLLPEAKSKGAAAALVNHYVENSPLPLVIVPDTVIALGELAQKWRDQFNLQLIGLTGSNGKTTVKEMIAAIFAKAIADSKYKYLASAGNLNTEIGMPLTLLELSENHRYAVIEMAMRGFNEIAYLSKIAKPNVAVITNAYPSHLERVGNTLEGVARAKGEIFQGLTEEGTAILNADDEFFNYWRRLLKYPQNSLTFGLYNKADFMAANISNNQQSQKFTLISPVGQIEVNLPLLGQHNVQNALVAAAACFAIGIDLLTIKAGLEAMQSVSQRLAFKSGINGATIIDDTYNANPASLKAALDTLAQLSGTKVLVLGDMKELGENAEFYHAQAGEYARQNQVDYLFAFGDLAKHAVKSFNSNSQHFSEKSELISTLKPLLKANMHVLVKGSRSMRMEDVVKELVV